MTRLYWIRIIIYIYTYWLEENPSCFVSRNSLQLQNTCDFGGLIFFFLGGCWVCSPLVLPSSDMISTNNGQPRGSTTGITKGIIKLPKLGWNDTHLNVCANFLWWDFPEIILEFSPQKHLWGKKTWSNWTHFFRRVGSIQPTTYRETANNGGHHLRGCYFATSSKYSDHYACNIRLPRWSGVGWWFSKGSMFFFSEIRW